MSKSITIKMGGARGIPAEPVCRDIARLVADGWRVAVVHGGSHDVDMLAARCGTATRTLTSPSGYQSRYTDAATLSLVVAAIAGQANMRLVQHLLQSGVRAFGLSGVDARFIVARRKAALRAQDAGRIRIVRDDYSGEIRNVDAVVLETIFAAGWTPVIAPLSITDEGDVVNIDADRVAGAVAVAIGSDALIMLTNVPGVLENPVDPTTLVRHLQGTDIASWENRVSGRMKMKITSARRALADGVKAVVIADARVDDPIRRALSREQGTWMEKAAA
jgi:acetylglutamate/LysW-gamma-L-alpha-aminoadipate kinase